MPSTGTIQVHAYTSKARIPLKDVSIAITAPDGTLLALRQTDRSGRIEPVVLPVPERSASLSPDADQTPYISVDLHANTKGYEQITVRNVQLFADTVTDQDLEMVPLSELPSAWDKTEYFTTTPQNL